MPARASLLLMILCVLGIPAIAQTIRGDVLDMDTKKPVSGVSIQNIYTLLDITTDDQGGFIIAANSGQLLEFKKTGYKTARVRVPQGYIPPYFRILVKKGISDIKPDMYVAHNNRYDYTEFEKEKYVDKTFNEEVITKFTGLKGDSLHYFIRRYRPSYEQLKSMNDYALYNFIKASVQRYRMPNTPRNGN